MDFEKLKSSYILSIQSGLLAGVGYEDIKNANKVINHFCKYYIDAGVSNEAERAEMKHELHSCSLIKLTEMQKYWNLNKPSAQNSIRYCIVFCCSDRQLGASD